MSAPIGIGYVINSMIVGGSQTHLVQVMRFLDRDRFAPTFYCIGGEGELLDAVRATGVDVLLTGSGESYRGVGLARRVWGLSRSFRERRLDIVHNYLLRANFVGSLAARLARVPIVLCSKRGCHHMEGGDLLMAKVGNALADRVTANAEAVRDFVHLDEGCALAKMPVIPSGIDTDRFQPLPAADYKQRLGLPADCTAVGIVTRMRTRKGVEEFVRAIGELRRTRPDVHGVIVGEVSLDDVLEGIVREYGLDGHLSLLGRRSDMPEVLSAFDLFVLSSHDEGMSNAVLEGMAMQLPVVATDVGGTGEVVRHGESGLLVPAKDPGALAAAMADVLADRERAGAMGRLGREIVVARFSAPAMVRQMEDLYFEIARSRNLALGRAAAPAA
jgi:glycosyltransferase involved in cell wall biosynthesis